MSTTESSTVSDLNQFAHFGVPRTPFPNDTPPRNWFERKRKTFYNFFNGPVSWMHDKVIEPNRLVRPAYYHRKFARVPTIDECHEGDFTCYFEANEQFKRDKIVDGAIIKILRKRKEACFLYEKDDWAKNCHQAMEDVEDATTNFFLRYGEVGGLSSVVAPYMRLKHRMIWERRNPDKVDFMYAKNRQENRYVVPMQKGLPNSTQLPDNTRTRYAGRTIDLHYPESTTRERKA